MLADCLGVIAASLLSAGISEGLSWLLLYRTPAYQKLKGQIDRLQGELDKRKGEVVSAVQQKVAAKRTAKLESDLTDLNRDMATTRMKSTLVLSVTMIVLLGVLNNWFEGRVVAKLPFEPISFIQGISHRGLAGDDFTDCSALFLYIICSMGIRTSLQKYLGFTPPPSPTQGLFAPPKTM